MMGLKTAVAMAMEEASHTEREVEPPPRVWPMVLVSCPC